MECFIMYAANLNSLFNKTHTFYKTGTLTNLWFYSVMGATVAIDEAKS